MNDGCSANGTSSGLIASLTSARDTLDTYPFRIVSGVGVIFNYYTLYALNRYRRRYKFHDFFICRCFCNLVVCFLALFSDLNQEFLIEGRYLHVWKLTSFSIFIRCFLIHRGNRNKCYFFEFSKLIVNFYFKLLFSKSNSSLVNIIELNTCF